jgi:hypothetical protein
VKPGDYACYVVENRKVKGLVLPTDIVTKEFFERAGFEYIDTFFRMIPNKRMPSRNSPTNAVGKVDSTMISEYIVVMRKKITRAVMEKSRPQYVARKTKRRKTKISSTHPFSFSLSPVGTMALCGDEFGNPQSVIVSWLIRLRRDRQGWRNTSVNS